jgi:hypothetical protein
MDMIYKNPYSMGIVAAIIVFGATIAFLTSTATTAGAIVFTMPSDIKNSWLSFGGPSTGPDMFGSVTIPQAIQKMEDDTAHANYAETTVTTSSSPYLSSAVPIKVGTLALIEAIQQLNSYRPNNGDAIISLAGGELVDPFGSFHSVSQHNVHYDIPAGSWLDFN